MLFMNKYSHNIYYTKPSYSELLPNDVILSRQILETYIDYEEIEVNTRLGTYQLNVRIEKTRPITIYYVVSAAEYQQILADFPLKQV